MSKHIYGVHDVGAKWMGWIRAVQVTGWAVESFQYDERPSPSLFSAKSNDVVPIARLNWSHHGKGTIPPRWGLYNDFAHWCRDFAGSSPCSHFIIGNEPNIKVEWGGDTPISPVAYAQCFEKVYVFIKDAVPEATVMPAAVGPWNVESGIGWIEYFQEMLTRLDGFVDAINLHTYSRGYDPLSVRSESKMAPPWDHYYNGFRSYRDFLAAVPPELRHLPVFITETNGNGPWPHHDTAWVSEAYGEINQWNEGRGNQKIHALCLFRWASFDEKWSFATRDGVHDDFKRALSRKYEIPAQISVPPTPPAVEKAVTMMVVASVLNVRSGPGIEHTILRSVRYGDALDLVVQDGDWYKLQGEEAWVHKGWVKVVQSKWDRIYAFIRKWEGGWIDHPRDKGGPTMAGITLTTFRRWREQYAPTLPRPSENDLRHITDDEISEIYYQLFYIESEADKLEWPLALMQMDTAVNGGVGRAKEMFERSQGNPWAYMGHLTDWYSRLEDFDVFGRGWVRRRADLMLEAARPLKFD